MIGIVSYGLGNISAFSNIYKSLDIPHVIIDKYEQLDKVKKIILPGVGAFDDAMNQFNQSGLRDSVEKMVLDENIPLLGVCVGLQMLGNSSDEGHEKGLGWIDGNIKLIDTSNIDASIFGTGKFFKEKKEVIKENIYSEIDDMLSSTLKN